MKNISILLVSIIILINGCIPSLHPLVTEETRVLEDDILGLWQNLSVPTLHHSIEVRTEVQGEDSSEVSKATKLLEDMNELNLAQSNEGNQWLFERVGRITFEEGAKSASIHPAVPSLMDWPVVDADLDDYYMLTYTQWERKDTSVERMWCELTHIEGELFMDFSPSYLKNPVYNEDARFGINYISGHTFAKIEFTEQEMLLKPIDGEFISDLIEQERIRLKHEVVDEQIILTASTKELRAFIGRYMDNSKLFADPEILLPI